MILEEDIKEVGNVSTFAYRCKPSYMGNDIPGMSLPGEEGLTMA